MIKIKQNVKLGSGFDSAHEFEGWKIAYITSAEQYGDLKVVKRHTQTDEVFILINAGINAGFPKRISQPFTLFYYKSCFDEYLWCFLCFKLL